MKKQYVASVGYWHGEAIEHSDPRRSTSPEFATREEAEAWGRTTANTSSPWPERDYEDWYEVSEYVERRADDGYLDTVETHRWTYYGDRLDEELTEHQLA